jgi:hypothetical protein
MMTKPGFRMLSAAVVVVIAACGGRDPLESGVVESPGAGGLAAGGSTNGSGGTLPGTGGTLPGSGGTPGTGGMIGLGGFGTAGSGPIEIGRRCIRCATQQCPAATECFLDQACRDGSLCVISTCLGAGGTPDPTCLNACFGGDTQAAARALLAVTCLVTNCSTSCQP